MSLQVMSKMFCALFKQNSKIVIVHFSQQVLKSLFITVLEGTES